MSEDFRLPPPQPLLVVVSGPSGVGKDSVLRELMARELGLHFVVTATTRPPRQDEVHGEDYLFISDAEFAAMVENDEFLEHAIVYGQNKGIPKQQVREALASGLDVILRVDVQGAATVKALCPDALLIFLTTQSEAELERRLLARRSETSDALRLRIATARQELQRLSEFDYCVVNRENCLGETVEAILAIIKAEHHRVEQRVVSL